MAFSVSDPDTRLSPFTGMARRHWIESGRFLLEGVFRHVKGMDSPVALPRRPGKTYPQPDDPAWKHRSAELEGLSRTFMIASGILACDEKAEVAGVSLRDYYAGAILRATDPRSEQFVGLVSRMKREFKVGLFQHTCEGAALAMSLAHSRRAVWDRYTREEKDRIAAVLLDYADERTNSHNWRFFNVVMASFLRLEGYETDETTFRDHLQNLTAYYAGDGWYRDGATFDYYSAWAFQFYGPIWCRLYGYEREPEVAAVIERRHAEMMRTYPLMFSRAGKSLMWGRSIIYRCAASAPFGAHFMLRRTSMDPGWARRIASGNLLQFVTRDDVFEDGVPTLGFYRTFEPLVQSYSCAASPFWLAKIYLALTLAGDSPFWTAVENEGEWPAIGRGARTYALPGPGLAVTAHGRTGAAEVRPGKVPGQKSDPNYSRLSYNTELLWEDGSKEGATAMTYALRELEAPAPEMHPLASIRFAGERKGVLYRQAPARGWMSRIDLADVIVPGGVLRADRLRLAYSHEMRLGHYALPHVAGRAAEVRELEVEGARCVTASIPDGRGVALVAISGFDGVGSEVHSGLNPEADGSTVVYAVRRRERHYGGVELAVALMLHRTDGGEWTDEDLWPFTRLEPVAWSPSGSPCGLRVRLATGQECVVDFADVEGRLAD